jgi:hypothetical protein
MPQKMESRSSIITATIDASTTMPSDKHAKTQGSNSPSVGSMLTFKMALPSKISVTSQKAHGSNCSTRAPAGRRWSTLLCDHMPCKMQPTFTRTYQCWRMAPLGWSFSGSIQVGSNLRHVHTFGCPVFALQNMLAYGSQLPRWSPRAHLELNLWPSPMHTRNVYLILNLVTGCVSPQYHCRFDIFFETTCHGAPDVSGTICWQKLANLDHVKTVLSKVSVPNQHSVMYLETPSDEEPHTMSNPIFNPNTFGTTSDNYSVSEASQVSENSHTSQKNQSSHTTDELTPVEPTVTAGTSQRGQVCTMSQRMAKSVSQ